MGLEQDHRDQYHFDGRRRTVLTIPFMVAAMNGPHVIYAWIAGLVLALADGLVYAQSALHCREAAADISTCARPSSRLGLAA
jgi:hypothetical protein